MCSTSAGETSLSVTRSWTSAVGGAPPYGASRANASALSVTASPVPSRLSLTVPSLQRSSTVASAYTSSSSTSSQTRDFSIELRRVSKESRLHTRSR